MFKRRHPSQLEVFPRAGAVRSSLALEIFASVLLIWVGLWTLLWLALPTQGVTTGSWFGFFGSPVAMGLFAVIAIPLGLFFCLIGIPRPGTDAILLRPIYSLKMVLALYRYARSGWDTEPTPAPRRRAHEGR
jgi:hypothetical protein